MTITYHKGDIFTSKATYIVIPINCELVFGAGLAKQFKLLHPDLVAYSKKLCEGRTLFPGDTFKVSKYILAATKGNWRNPSKMGWIVDILHELKSEEINVAFPPLGCGLGGLDPIEFRVLAKWFFTGSRNNYELWDNV